MTEPVDTAEEHSTCSTCGHQNVPSASFCARCGRSLDDETSTVDDTETTTAYVPISSTGSHAASSPWAPPSSDSGADPDSGQTAAFSVSQPYAYSDDEPELITAQQAYSPQESVRGFWLGIVASLLIAAVLALYVYSAWLSSSARDTVDGWLPWVT